MVSGSAIGGRVLWYWHRMHRTLPLVLVSAIACGPSITMVPTNSAPRPMTKRPPADVEVFTTRLPKRPYVEVAVFGASKGKTEDHIDALRERAADYGCDGLVFTVMPSQQDVTISSGKPGELSKSSNGTAVGSSSATCVVWSDPVSGSIHRSQVAAPSP